jgi:hypothetical protein
VAGVVLAPMRGDEGEDGIVLQDDVPLFAVYPFIISAGRS